MKKELLFSLIGHVLLFLILVTASRPHVKVNLYPEIFQISVVSLASGFEKEESPSAVSIIDKTTIPIKKKEIKSKEKLISTKTLVKTSSNIGLKLSSKGGKYSYYIDAILTKIGSNWFNPFEGSDVKFSATIYFVIKKDGKITSVKIEKSSGNEVYDRAAERAVIITQTLPPLAGEFIDQDSILLHLEFEYKP